MAWQYIGDGEWYDPVTGEYAYGDAGSSGSLGSNGSNWTSGNTADLNNNSNDNLQSWATKLGYSGNVTPLDRTFTTSTTSNTSSGYDASALPADFDVTTYAYLNPGLVTYYNEIIQKPEIYSDYWGRSITEIPSLEEFLKEHYVRSGAKEGRKYKQDAAATTEDEGGGDYSYSSSDSGGGGGGYSISGSSGLSSYASWVSSLLANAKSAEQEATEKQAFQYARQSLSYAANALTDLEKARAEGAATGQLSDEEKALFDEIESNSLQILKDELAEVTAEDLDAAIVDLVNRGVLNGTVGRNMMKEIASENLKAYSNAAASVISSLDTSQLGYMQNKANQFIQREANLLGIGENAYETAAQSNISNLALGLNSVLALAGLASNQAIAEAQLASAWDIANLEAETSWDIANLNASTSLSVAGLYANAANWQAQLSANTSRYGYDVNAATALAVARMQANAANKASGYGLVGDIVGALAQVLGSNSVGNFFNNL